MSTARLFILFLLLSVIIDANGQCPDRFFLWKRILYLRDSTNVVAAKQLEELLGYHKQIEKCNERNDSTSTLLLQRIGWLFTEANDHYNAIQFTLKSIAIAGERSNPAINHAMAIKSYWNLHFMYEALGLDNKRISAVDSCASKAIYLDNGYDYALGSFEILVPVFFNMGDYYRCLQYATLAENLNQKIGATKMEAEEINFFYFTWKINALNFLKRYSEAEQLLTAKIAAAKTTAKKDWLGTLYGLYAAVLREQDQPMDAITYFKKCFQSNLQIRHQDGCAQALNNIGFVYLSKLHQHKQALVYYFKALKFADANESLNILGNIGNIYAATGKFDSSFFYFQQAFNKVQDGFNESNLLQDNNIASSGNTTEYVSGLVLDKAAAYLKKYKTVGDKNALTESIRIYEIADKYFDKLKMSQAEIQSKLSWKTNNRRLYEQAIEASYLNNNVEKGFYFFEKSRSVLLNDEIAAHQHMDEKTLAKQAQLKKNILELERSLQNTTASPGNAFSIQKELLTNKQELQVLTNEITQKQGSFSLNNTGDGLVTPTIVRRKIVNERRSLIELYNGDSAVFILSISATDMSFVKLDKQSYDSLVSAYITYISQPELLNRNFNNFATVSSALHTLLFQYLKIPKDGSLVISPDGRSFPFESLISNNLDQPDYLVNHYATSYTYSAKYLVNEYSGHGNKKTNLLGIAPVNFASKFKLASLAGSDHSLQNIQAIIPGVTNLVLGNATRNNFLQHFSDYTIIQLYTHASDSSSNNDPVIYFADSAFYLSDLITGKKPCTQLVVLSACETANGKLYKGEGIFSFNRGFAAIGIPAAVSNLWSVDNESTYRITELFYRFLGEGHATDIALQKAKLAFIQGCDSKEKQLPYYWAGIILTGKTNKIELKKSFPWGYAAAAPILLFVGFFVGRSILKSKKRTF